MKKSKRSTIIVATVSLMMSILMLSLQPAKSGPFGRCGEVVADTQDTLDDGFIQIECNYHFFKCQCSR